MATKKIDTKLKTFNVSADLGVTVSVEVQANDWESALEQAKQLKITNFITIDGDFLDDEPVKITGIYIGED